MSLVGLTSGSIIVDAFDKFPMNLIAQYKLKQIVSDMNKKGGSLKFETSGFNDMKSKRMDAFYNEILPFPKTVTYINAIGISYSSQGIPRADSDMKSAQQELLRKVNPSSGANDAFVEFPYSEIPNEWVGADDKNNYQIVFDSPHNLMAGSILGYDLQKESDRPIILGAMFLTVLDAIDKQL